jgi:exodeoxyribonuclease V beta subunit
VDLVFEWQGSFYIIDYKSNLLGQSSNFYAAEFLRKAMVSSAYPLQYLIYTVALHRYLQTRLLNYDYDQHMGGSYYLFLRGMRPEEAGSGVFYDLPDRDLIECLDHALRIQ